MLFLQTLADGAVHVAGVDDVVGVVVVVVSVVIF